MLLLETAVVFLTVFLCCDSQSPPVAASADCNDAELENDAGRTLDLINKHRRGGYVFTLLRVADAHIQHTGNASILYFTLDVLDTECPVLSRKDWSSCGHRAFYRSTEFGQCKAVLYKSPSFKKEELFGYNCTISPVPQQLYECKDCPVRVTHLLDAEPYIEEAKRILEKYNQESNETRNFRVEKVEKAFLMVGSRTGHYVEFTIREADSPSAGSPTNASKSKFPSKPHGRMGFCIGRVVQDPEVVAAESCVIYDIPYGKHPFHHHHHHLHNDSREFYQRCNVSGQEDGPPPPGPPHRDHHHHHHHRHHPRFHHHHHDHHPHNRHRHSHDDSGESHQHPNMCGKEHEPLPSGPPQRDHDDHHRHHPHFHHHHHDNHPHHHHRHSPDDSGKSHHHPNMCGKEHEPLPSGPPQRDHDDHHPDHCHHCGSPCPPDGPCDHPSPRHFHKHGRRRQHHNHDRRCKDFAGRQGGSSSEDRGSFMHHHPFHHHEAYSVYYIPVQSLNDVLTAPGANFLDQHPRGPHRGPKKHFPDCRHTDEKPAVQPFPEIPSQSKSCPGNLKFEPPVGLLPLYPSQPKQ